MNIDRERVIAAAFDLLKEEGLDKLTMRALATRLSVQAPALYWYFEDKGQLLSWMAAAIYAQARTANPHATDWREWLIGFGHALRRSLTAHPNGARLCAIAQPIHIEDANGRRHAIAAPLLALGLTESQSLTFQASVISLTLGWASFQENGPMHDFLDTIMDFDAAFDFGLRALVEGYERDVETIASASISTFQSGR
jgi:TetR/AcrR family tetracycline transcriptional repressor